MSAFVVENNAVVFYAGFNDDLGSVTDGMFIFWQGVPYIETDIGVYDTLLGCRKYG